MSKKLSKAQYVERYGIEKYVTKQYRPKYRYAAMKKLEKQYPKAVIGKPVGIKEQPSGLREYQEDVRWHIKVKGLSYKEARKKTKYMQKWLRRKKFSKYPAKIRRRIIATYKKARSEGREGKQSGIPLEHLSLEAWVGES